MLHTTRKGFSLVEILIAISALAIIMLGVAQFTADIFKVSANHASQLNTVNYARLITERVITQISKAGYIYPAQLSISITGRSINTSSSIAMLIPDDNSRYFFVAYYSIDTSDGKADLYEFTSSNNFAWTKNANPATSMMSFSGSSSIIAKDIIKNNTTLQYILDYQNASYDSILKGSISGVTQNSSNALVKGIDWKIAQGTSRTQTIQVKGISNNVPRFIE